MKSTHERVADFFCFKLKNKKAEFMEMEKKLDELLLEKRELAEAFQKEKDVFQAQPHRHAMKDFFKNYEESFVSRENLLKKKLKELESGLSEIAQEVKMLFEKTKTYEILVKNQRVKKNFENKKAEEKILEDLLRGKESSNLFLRGTEK